MAEEEFIQILLRASFLPQNLHNGRLTGLALFKFLPEACEPKNIHKKDGGEGVNVPMDYANHNLDLLTTI